MRKDGRETRQNIIEKSLQIFSVKGYYNTSVSDIMGATGLTKGGLYAHFDSKEEIWNAAYEKAVEMKGIVFKGVRKVSDPLHRLRKRSRTTCATTAAERCSRAAVLLQQPRRTLGPVTCDERPDRRRIHGVRGPPGLLAGRGEVRGQA